jgi:hypothetical protein
MVQQEFKTAIGDIRVNPWLKIRGLGFYGIQKKPSKKRKKKLASPWHLPLNGDPTGQTGRKSRSKKL